MLQEIIQQDELDDEESGNALKLTPRLYTPGGRRPLK